jgi:hypothetical protein
MHCPVFHGKIGVYKWLPGEAEDHAFSEAKSFHQVLDQPIGPEPCWYQKDHIQILQDVAAVNPILIKWL